MSELTLAMTERAMGAAQARARELGTPDHEFIDPRVTAQFLESPFIQRYAVSRSRLIATTGLLPFAETAGPSEGGVHRLTGARKMPMSFPRRAVADERVRMRQG